MNVIVIMGVSGCGKTTVGQALAARLGVPFWDGDDFHPPENVAKMARGIPLTDADRLPWLTRLQALIHDHLAQGGAVLACSALKRHYRDQLRAGNDGVRFVYLQGDFNTIRARIKARQGHFMKPEMLHSQFNILEEPSAEEALRIAITGRVEQMVEKILSGLSQ